VSEATATEIAAEVVRQLGQNVVAASIPAEIGQWVRDTCRTSMMVYRQLIPMNGGSCLNTEWRLGPDGRMHLELSDTNGRIFWRGTFVPEP
jgi:hypothetical protein